MGRQSQPARNDKSAHRCGTCGGWLYRGKPCGTCMAALLREPYPVATPRDTDAGRRLDA